MLEYGLIPELVGRLPVMSHLSPLREPELVRIMLEPRNAIVRQYQKKFEMEDCLLEFHEDALLEIAKEALSKKTGVRAVRSIVEALLLEVQYELPSSKERTKFVITPEFVRGEGEIVRERLPKVQKRESA